MSRIIVWRPRAEADLIDIWTYIADENESAADRLLGKIDTILKMLSDHPEAGRARPELQPNIRSFPVGNYIVFYQPGYDRIEVVRILSGYVDIDQADVH